MRAGLAGRRLGEVGGVGDHRLGPQEFRLANEAVHPGAARLVVALPIIEVGETQRLSIGVESFIDPDIGLIGRDVGPALEGQAIHLVGCVEDAVLQHIPDFQIWLGLLLIEVVFRLAHLLRIELPVPGLEFEAAFVGIDGPLNLLRFPLLRRCGRDHPGRS